MHELGLCEEILGATLRRAGGRRVARVRVRVGGHPVDAGVIDQGFRMAAAGTAAADADIDVVVEPPGRCRACGHLAPATDPMALLACPRCQSLDVEATGEDWAVLESITFHDGSPRT